MTDTDRPKIGPCRACHKAIVFLRTSSGKAMPVDVETIQPDDREFDAARHRSHFATCTAPSRFRRAR